MRLHLVPNYKKERRFYQKTRQRQPCSFGKSRARVPAPPFPLLGLDSNNRRGFPNHPGLGWLRKREGPVFMTRRRPCKRDDNGHAEQRNWTQFRQGLGHERHDNPEVVERIRALTRGPCQRLPNDDHASLKPEGKKRRKGRTARIYGAARTPLARVLESAEATPETKARPEADQGRMDLSAWKQEIEAGPREIVWSPETAPRPAIP